jgi:hypothetical protein
MKGFVVGLALLAGPLSAQPAPRVTKAVAPNDLAALETIRAAVWRDWFSGDTAALRRSLGPELIAMSTGAKYWQTLDETIVSSAKFKTDGGKFVSVAFDSSMTHRFGDAVVMFSRYAVVTEGSAGPRTIAGRATEVFVRANGRWVHTSWHLDNQP